MVWHTIQLNTIALITLLTLIEAPALALIRMGSIENIFIAALIFALGVVPLLSVALQYEGIGVVNFFWNVQSTILMFAIGVLGFNERISKLQVFGVALSLLGMGIVALSKE
jgi:multidrug transporter EmrE-like cation transporter